MLPIASFVYQLLYFKLVDKNLSIEFHKSQDNYDPDNQVFEISNELKEYLDILSIEKNSNTFLSIPKELKDELYSFNINFSFYDDVKNLFEFVKYQSEKLNPSASFIFNLFVKNEELFLRYFDHIFNYSRNLKVL